MKKNLLIALSILLVACGQKNTNQEENSKQNELKPEKEVINADKYVGTFEFVYPYNTEDLIENHYIVISKTDMNYSGLYYGTSDEFDDNREGYYPGFFIAEMNNLKIDADTITFSLLVENEDIFDKPVELKYKSANEARNAGYTKWIQVLKFEPKEYKGIFSGEKIIFKNDVIDKEFIKK